MSTPVPGPLSVTPLYAAGAGDELVSWDDAGGQWRQVAIPPGATGAVGPMGPAGPTGITGPAGPTGATGPGTSGTLNALMVGNGAGQPLVSSAITSDNGSTLRVTTNAVIGNAVTSPPTHALVINNAASTPQPASAQLLAASETGAQIVVDSYGPVGSTLIGRGARGTAAAPTATQIGDILVGIYGQGRGASGYGGASALFQIAAYQNWTDTAQGSVVNLLTTPNGGTTPSTRMQVAQGVMVWGSGGFPVGGDTGPGTINVAGGYYVNGGGTAGVALVASGNNYINTGNLGIGTTGPQAKFQVVDLPAAGGVAVGIASGPNGADATTVMVQFWDYAITTGVGAIVRTGTNSVVYGTASDARLKADVGESQRGLDALMAIKVSDYTMGDTASQGLLAQDVAKVYPEAVHEGGDDPNLEPWMIDYGRLTPLLIKAIQDLAAKVEALSAPSKAG